MELDRVHRQVQRLADLLVRRPVVNPLQNLRLPLRQDGSGFRSQPAIGGHRQQVQAVGQRVVRDQLGQLTDLTLLATEVKPRVQRTPRRRITNGTATVPITAMRAARKAFPL